MMKPTNNGRRPFIEIPQSVLDAGYSRQVHVKGWNPGCKFRYLGTINGFHQLVTPKTGKKCTTRNPLCYLRLNEPATASVEPKTCQGLHWRYDTRESEKGWQSYRCDGCEPVHVQLVPPNLPLRPYQQHMADHLNGRWPGND